MEKLEKSLQINPENSDAWFTLAWQYTRQKNYGKSDSLYTKGIQYAQGTSYESLAWQAWIGAKIDQDSMEAAKKLAESALKTASETADGYVTRAIVYLLQQDSMKALEAGQKALELDPGNGIALKIMMQNYMAQKMYQEAINITQGISLEKQWAGMYAEIFNHKAMAYNFSGQYDSAFAVIKRVIQRSPKYAAPYSTLAESYGFTGNTAAFFNSLEQSYALGLQPDVIDWDSQPYIRYKHHAKARKLRKLYDKE
ncbi:MAG: tetratricopeptide repeat protein [Saprospiraceae bacterium]|nr:tetratricopeptide repeat protein [Saprospiraceae bacterium]